MISKIKEKQRAIVLRKEGLSYNEILKLVPVAKSTLSVWLRAVGVAKKHEQRFTEKRRQAQIKAQQACKEKRIKITTEIKSAARKEIGKISKRELWLLGVALYWAEGSKERQKSTRVQFSNSDPRMIKLFLQWLKRCCNVSDDKIIFAIYLHETAFERKEEIKKYWSEITGFSLDKIQSIVWKKNKINTKRKNIGNDYYGLLRVIVRRSTNFNRKISGWTEGVCQNCGIV